MRSSTAHPLPSAASSCCSDLREINEAKVTNILTYLDGVSPGPQHRGGLSTSCDLRQSYGDEESFHPVSHFQSPSQAPWLRPSTPVTPWQGGNASVVSGITTIATENQVYTGIKNKVDALRATVETLQKENQSLTGKMADERKRFDKMLTTTRETAKSELDEALQQIRSITRQNAEATRTLISERDAAKRALDELSHKYNREVSTKQQDRETLESAHTTAISQLKGKWMAQEKLAREKWKEKELREMKQTTLKVLQPDIELLMRKHKAEKTRLEEEYQDELKRRDKLFEDKEASLEVTRSRIQSAAEARIAQERQLADDRARDEIQRMKRVMEEAEVLATKKRDSLQSIFDEREQALRYEIKKLEEELFDARRKNMEGTAQFRDAVSSEVSKLSITQDGQLQAAKDQLARELRDAKQRCEAEMQAALAIKEEELRARFKLDLDRSVAQMNERLEAAFIAKVSEMKESDRMTRAKLSKQESALSQLTTDLELAQSQIKIALENSRQKDVIITRLNHDLSVAKDAQENCGAMHEREFDERLRTLDKQWQQRLRQIEMDKVDAVNNILHQLRTEKLEWDNTRNTLEADIRSMEQRHNTELSGIGDKVHTTIGMKDGAIRQLNDRIAILEASLRDRDAALEQHRTLLEA